MATSSLKDKLKLKSSDLDVINQWLLKDEVVNDVITLVEKYGGVEAINKKMKEAEDLESNMKKLREMKSPYVKDLEWLIEQRDKKAFISMEDYRKKVLGDKYGKVTPKTDKPVTLEISALNNFNWLITEAKKAIANGELMPSRYILVRPMKEQESVGQLLPLVAAMKILGASCVETLDTKGTMPGENCLKDGGPVNVHLGGPATITGYFGGVGCPNDFCIKWVDEFLYYYTNYAIKEVLNVNPGTVMLGYLLHKLGVDIHFKISVFMGNDNPMSCFWTMMAAKLFSRDDGTTSLIGFNLSNSATNYTIEHANKCRKFLGFENDIRFEHHITECYRSIVRQPYHRLDELVDLCRHDVANISAKHEGALPSVDKTREHPSDILDYFLPMEKREELDKVLIVNYLDKHDAVNETARRLVENGFSVVAAPTLH